MHYLQDYEGLMAIRSFLAGPEKEKQDGCYTKYIDVFIDIEEFKKFEDKANRIYDTYLSISFPSWLMSY